MFEKLLRLIEILGEKAPVVIPLILELLRAFTVGRPAFGAESNTALGAADFAAESPDLQNFTAKAKSLGVDEAQARELALLVQRAEQQ